MPSPLNGLIAPAASPTTRYVGPACGPTESTIGRRPPVAGPQDVAGEMPHDSGAQSTNASISLVVLTCFHWLNVDSRPTPTFTRPSPTGKIQPYPGSTLPLASRTSRCDSIHGSSWRGGGEEPPGGLPLGDERARPGPGGPRA